MLNTRFLSSGRRRIPRPGLLLAVIMILAGVALPVLAHPADMFVQAHDIILTPDGVNITWQITPGALLAFLIWDEADTDGDGFISTAEAQTWITPHIPEYVVALDQTTALPWLVEAVAWPSSVARFEMGDEAITVTMTAAWPDDFAADGLARDVAIYNRLREAESINWFTLHATGSATFTRPAQHNGLLQFQISLADRETEADTLVTWDSGTPALLATTSGDETGAVDLPARTAANTITDLISQEEQSPLLILLALVVALALGAIHALTPGHGKTLVAAYLVGSRGTPRHAIVLGLIVTLTHTGSVLAIGLITLAFSRYILPTDIFPVLEIASGLLIMAMGLVLLLRRYRGWQSVQALRVRKAAEAISPLNPAIEAPATKGRPARTIAINQPIQARTYDDVLPAGDISVGAINWRSLLTLGVSGGLVPCPDAIAILLVAIAINRLALGLSLVVIFSLGLAVVLIAIGLAMVQSRRLAERFTAFDRFVPVMPLLSAVIVLLLGVGLTWGALNRAGTFGGDITASAGETLLAGLNREAATGFQLNTASVIFLAPDEDGHDQLHIVPAIGHTTGDSPQPLTSGPLAVWDYALAPDGSRIAYAGAHETGSGSTLWLKDLPDGEPQLLLDCPAAGCRNVVWSPDGSQIVYEYTDFAQTTGSGMGSLWRLEVATGATGPLFQDGTIPGFSVRWSADGRWLSYITASMTGGSGTSLQVYNLADGSSTLLPTNTGAAAIWHPTEPILLMTDVQPAGGRYLTHLLRYDALAGTLTDLTETASDTNATMEDVTAAWSPDGSQIALVRRVISEESQSPGNQIWLMNAAGSDVRPLTDNTDTIHQAPVWSPDGQTLLLMAFQLTDEWAKPRVWRIDVTTNTQTELAHPGSFPIWQW